MLLFIFKNDLPNFEHFDHFSIAFSRGKSLHIELHVLARFLQEVTKDLISFLFCPLLCGCVRHYGQALADFISIPVLSLTLDIRFHLRSYYRAHHILESAPLNFSPVGQVIFVGSF